MEEKLRNLSQNIANNTGEEHQPKHHHPEDDAPKEEEHHEEEPREEEPREEEHHEEEISDYTPEPEEQSESDKPDESDDSREAIKEDSQIFEGAHEGEQSMAGATRSALRAARLDDDENQPESSQPQESSSDSSSEAKILTIEEEPAESPTRTKKYSPEVEAALNRLNTEDASVDLSEPLSTEPKKKGHGAHIFLFILFLLAVAAVTLCILVEQKIIDNPFPNIFNKPESSQTAPADTSKTETKTDTETKADTETKSSTEETTEPTRGTSTDTGTNTNTEEK